MTPALTWLCPDLVFDGETLRSGMAMGIANDRIQSLCRLKDLPADAPRRVLAGRKNASGVPCGLPF